MRPFRVLQAASIAEASALLQRYGERAQLYAGGTELLLLMKKGIAHWDVLIDLKPIPNLQSLDLNGESHVVIGAAVTHRAVERSPIVARHLPVLAEAERSLANIRVRNVGTIGGNLCFADPHSDLATVLLLHEAEAVLEDTREARTVPLTEFFLSAYEAVRRPDELMACVRVPTLPRGMHGAYLRLAAQERPTASVAVATKLVDGAVLEEVRVAVGCVPPVPMRLHELEILLQHEDIQTAVRKLRGAESLIARALSPVSDIYGSKEYKVYLVGVLIGRALRAAIHAGEPAVDA